MSSIFLLSHNCRIYVKRTGFSSFSPLSEWIFFLKHQKGRRVSDSHLRVWFWCSTAWEWWLQLRSFESKLGMLSPLSRYHATEAGESIASSQHAHRSECKPETPCHVAAPSCLLCIWLLDFSSSTKEIKQQKIAFLKMSYMNTHQTSIHWSLYVTTWQFFLE